MCTGLAKTIDLFFLIDFNYLYQNMSIPCSGFDWNVRDMILDS